MEYEIGYTKRRFTWPEGRNTEEQNEQYNPSTPNISFGSIASTQHLRSNIVRTPEKILKHVAYSKNGSFKINIGHNKVLFWNNIIIMGMYMQ